MARDEDMTHARINRNLLSIEDSMRTVCKPSDMGITELIN